MFSKVGDDDAFRVRFPTRVPKFNFTINCDWRRREDATAFKDKRPVLPPAKRTDGRDTRWRVKRPRKEHKRLDKLKEARKLLAQGNLKALKRLGLSLKEMLNLRRGRNEDVRKLLSA